MPKFSTHSVPKIALASRSKAHVQGRHRAFLNKCTGEFDHDRSLQDHDRAESTGSERIRPNAKGVPMEKEGAAASAIRKLEDFYFGLEPDERKVIALIVSSSVQRAARAQAERDWLKEGELLLQLLTPQYASRLVSDLGTYVAGQAAPMRPGSMAEKRPLG